MPLADRCSLEFDHQVRSRGEQYFRGGRVELGPSGRDTVQATVAGSSGEYQVYLDWSDARGGVVEVLCTCPYFEDRGPCKHIWATILAADAQGLGPLRGSRRLTVLDADSDDWGPDVDPLEALEDDEAFLGGLKSAAGHGRVPVSRREDIEPAALPWWAIVAAATLRGVPGSSFRGPGPCGPSPARQDPRSLVRAGRHRRAAKPALWSSASSSAKPS